MAWRQFFELRVYGVALPAGLIRQANAAQPDSGLEFIQGIGAALKREAGVPVPSRRISAAGSATPY